MKLHIGRRKVIDVADLTDASRRYAQERRASGEGHSTFPVGTVKDGAQTYRISYNARVWIGETLVMEAA